MPTERFKRLPEEKIEAIRRAGIQEFTRTSPESASINRIIQEADISRGSFYTYFESKYDLLRWLISDRVRETTGIFPQMPDTGKTPTFPKTSWWPRFYLNTSPPPRSYIKPTYTGDRIDYEKSS